MDGEPGRICPLSPSRNVAKEYELIDLIFLQHISCPESESSQAPGEDGYAESSSACGPLTALWNTQSRYQLYGCLGSIQTSAGLKCKPESMDSCCSQ